MNLNSGRTTLIEAVADAQRRRAESTIRPPKDIEIFVEGHTDRKYLQKHNHDSKYTIKVFEKNGRGGKDLIIEEIQEKGIVLKSMTRYGVVEEAPEVYKDVDTIAEISHKLGLATKVAKLVPIGVIKG